MERFQLGEMLGSGGGGVVGRSYSIIGKVMQIGITLGELYSLVGLECRVYIENDERESWEYKWNENVQFFDFFAKEVFDFKYEKGGRDLRTERVCID